MTGSVAGRFLPPVQFLADIKEYLERKKRDAILDQINAEDDGKFIARHMRGTGHIFKQVPEPMALPE